MKMYCKECDETTVLDIDDDEILEVFFEALQSLRARRWVNFLDDLERALPYEFVGLADDILKWAGKSR